MTAAPYAGADSGADLGDIPTETPRAATADVGRIAPTDDTRAALEAARAEVTEARANGDVGGALWRIPASEHLEMIVAVRAAAAAGLTDAAIDACCEQIWPTLSQMSGSDFFTTGPRRDRRFIRRYLVQGRVDDAVEFIRGLSCLRWWVSVAGLTFLCLLTAAMWLLRR